MPEATSSLADVQSRPTQRPIGRSALLGTVAIVLSAWSLGSAAYIAYHDRLAASFFARQAQMQYAYEDRIAALQAALDAAESRGASEDASGASRWHDLDKRAARLEARAARLDALLANDRPPLAELPDAARRDAGALDDRPSDRRGAAPTLRLETIDLRQRRSIEDWSRRTRQDAARFQAALVQLGLADAPAADATGGPFVPVPDGAASDETELAMLRDDLLQRRRLENAVSRLPLRKPVAGQLEVTSGYGTRRDPFLGRLALHTGIDLREEHGTPVSAAASGIVTIAGAENGYGTTVEIDHGNGYATRYAHLATAIVVPGQHLAAGAVVGTVGTTGRSTGPHLHYEIRIAGEPIDPARYLALATMIAGR